MHGRRALILIATVFAISALVASLAPTRDRRAATTELRPPPARTPGSTSRPATVERRLSPRSRLVTVPAGSHVLLSVPVGAPGQVSIAGLGIVASAEPASPAAFDLLPERPGRYAVSFVGSDATTRRLGTLVVRR